MSLHKTANHLASKGRGPDTLLIHVAPSEVAGLQALAQAGGGSLTVNPETGLPEAGFLQDLLPSVIGAGISYFSGGTINPLESAGIVGGLAGLSSGNLGEGLKAGLGAYGGASLTGGLMGMGDAALQQRAAQAAAQAADTGASGPLSGAAFSNEAAGPASAWERLKAGATEAAKSPKDYLQNNKWAAGAAVLPALSGAMEQGGTSVTPLKSTGRIRQYERNPRTGALEQVESVAADEWRDRPAVTFGGVAPPAHYADGGPVTFGGVAPSANTQDTSDTRSDSQRAYDYLMGVPGAKNPMLFYHEQGPKSALPPVDMQTRTGGHYALNPNTNAYDWIPDASAAGAGAGLASLVPPDQQGRSSGMQPLSDSQRTFLDAEAARNEAQGLPANTLQGERIKNDLGWMGDVGKFLVPGGALMGLARNYFNPPEPATGGWIGESGPTTSTPVGLPTAPTPTTLPSMNTDGDGGGPLSGGAWNNRSTDGGDGGDSTSSGSAPGGGAANGGLMSMNHFAQGGLGSLGSYSDGGRLLRGPGDGVSDNIPATIGEGKHPARLANNEFVIPARIVSELGNGSTEAGAKRLYDMMDRVQHARKKSMGKDNIAVDTKAYRHLPA